MAVADEYLIDYVLIIEWLGSGDMKTGARLRDHLLGINGFLLPVQHVSCSSAQGVICAINHAAKNIGVFGTPIIQLEAHGYGEDASGEEGGIGCHRSDGQVEQLAWSTVWPVLRALNVATDHNLVIVAAACMSDLVLWGVNDSFKNMDPETGMGVKPAAFMAAAGFKGKVMDERVLAASIAFYESWHAGMTMDAAVKEACRKLPAWKGMDWINAGTVARKVIASDRWPIRVLGKYLFSRVFNRQKLGGASWRQFYRQYEIKRVVVADYAMSDFLGR